MLKNVLKMIFKMKKIDFFQNFPKFQILTCGFRTDELDSSMRHALFGLAQRYTKLVSQPIRAQIRYPSSVNSETGVTQGRVP